MKNAFVSDLAARIESLKTDGLFKQEQVITSPQQGEITLQTGTACINLCANNYLGLSNHPRLIEAARDALNEYGFGMSSVRFICGTQLPHKRLERRLSEFLGTEDTILFPSCFDANAGLFETLLGPEDAVISDALNHASIIDGVRLCKAKRFRYANNDMEDLEAKLLEAADARYRMIATDGVFSMDGYIADLPAICDLADRYDAMVMVDDSHAVGFVGASGRGTPEHCDVAGRVDILTGTLGKALGGRRRRLCLGPRRDRRMAASARAPVSFLQHARSRHCPDQPECAGLFDRLHRAPRAPVAQREPFSRRNDHARVRAAARRAPDRAPDAARPEAGAELRQRASRARCAGRRLLFSGRPARTGPDSYPDVGGSRYRGSGPRDRRLRRGRA